MGQTIKANFSRQSGPTKGLRLALVALFICGVGSFYLLINTFSAPLKVEQYASAEAISSAASVSECVTQELKTRLESGTPVLASELSDMKNLCDGIQKKHTLVKAQVMALYDTILARSK